MPAARALSASAWCTGAGTRNRNHEEAAGLGIDNLEHGFFAATDFVTDKKVALTSTLTVSLEAISISTLNGAKYMGRDARVGSLGQDRTLVTR